MHDCMENNLEFDQSHHLLGFYHFNVFLFYYMLGIKLGLLSLYEDVLVMPTKIPQHE